MNNKDIYNKLDIIFNNLKVRCKEIINNSNNSDIAVKKTCDYITSTVTVETKSLLSTLYSTMSKETLKESIFSSSENANKFYDLDLRSNIYKKYKFSPEDSIDYKEAYDKSKDIMKYSRCDSVRSDIPLTYSKRIIISVSTAIKAILYPLIKYRAEKRSKEALIIAVNEYIDKVKKDVILWFESIERYYNEKVNILKKSL